MGGKTGTSTSSVTIPEDVLARYNSVNAIAEEVAQTPYQQYSSDPNAFVAGLTSAQNAGLQQTANYANAAQSGLRDAYNVTGNGYLEAVPLYGQSVSAMNGMAGQAASNFNSGLGSYAAGVDTASGAANTTNQMYQNAYSQTGAAAMDATAANARALQPINNAQGLSAAANTQAMGLTNNGLAAASGANAYASSMLPGATGAVNAGQIDGSAINRYMNPYMNDVVNSQMALMAQQNAQQQSALKGTAAQSGAFGGDRAGIAAANLAHQQALANQSTLSNTLQQGYNTALATAQQQQGVNLAAEQANRAALQQGVGLASGLGQTQFNEASAAGQNLANIGNLSYNQNVGQGQALAALGQQQYAQQTGAAQQQAGIGQNMFNQASTLGQLQQALGGAQINAGQQYANLGQTLANTYQNAASGEINASNSTGASLSNIAQAQQTAGLAGAQAEMSAGQVQQQTEQAGLTALYNQFLQEQSYPFQTTQFLANIAEGTGSLSGQTTNTTQNTSFFSDRRLKENIREIGKAKNGLPIYAFNYKGDPHKLTRLGFMADEVEKKHPEAVGLAGGYKTVDYERAARAHGGLLVDRVALDGGGLASSSYDPTWSHVLQSQASALGSNAGGLYGSQVSDLPHGGKSYVPKTQASQYKMLTPTLPPQKTESGVKQVVGLANDVKNLSSLGDLAEKGYDKLKGLSGAESAAAPAPHDAPASQPAPESFKGDATGLGGYVDTPVDLGDAFSGLFSQGGAATPDVVSPTEGYKQGLAEAQAAQVRANQVQDDLRSRIDARGAGATSDLTSNSANASSSGSIYDRFNHTGYFADGGLARGHFADGGNPEDLYDHSGGLHIPNEAPTAKLPEQPKSQQSSSSGLGSTLGAVTGLLGLFLADGGEVAPVKAKRKRKARK